jgi:hypothetical protein
VTDADSTGAERAKAGNSKQPDQVLSTGCRRLVKSAILAGFMQDPCLVIKTGKARRQEPSSATWADGSVDMLFLSAGQKRGFRTIMEAA